MTPTKHASHPMKWETSKSDKEGSKYGKEGSRKEESYDRKQMPKVPMKK